MTRFKEGSFSSKVIKRFLNALHENGKLKKTTLAGKAGINYGMCVKYATFLAKIGWIEIRLDKEGNDDDVYEYISLSVHGRKMLEILNSDQITHDLDGRDSNIILKNQIDTGKKHNRKKYTPSNNPRGDSALQKAKTQLSASFLDSTTQVPHFNGSTFDNRKSNTSIMIVDDDADILFTYNVFLRSRGYNVKTFSDPIQALRHFAEESSSYDLIVLDIRMPQVNGIQLFQTFKSINREIKVMFVSCLDAAPELVSVFPEVKQDAILMKPIPSEHFVKAVETALT